MQQNAIDPRFDKSEVSASRPVRLRAMLGTGRCRIAPETPDGLLARMVAMAGFELAFVGLMGSSLNRIGHPDAGLLTATELVDNAARCIAASGLATVVDAGSGFGNPINVRRTVTDLQRAGAGAILLRDSEEPRAHRTATDAVPAADMAAKLKAAADVRGVADFVLLAGIEGATNADSLAATAERAACYLEAGAEVIHVGLLRSRSHAVSLAGALRGLPLACSLAPDSEMSAAELGPLGFSLAFFPHCGLMAAVPAIEHTFDELFRTGSVGALRPHIANFSQFTEIAGLPQVQRLEERYGVPEAQRTTL